MAVGYFTSDSLLDAIKRDSFMPANQQTFSDTDLLNIANQEIRISMLPAILQYHEEFYVRESEDITIVADVSRYAIPYRAIGQKFRDLYYRDSSGNLNEMVRVQPEERPYYESSGLATNYIYYYIEGNDIVLLPSVSSSVVGSLVFTYFFRPNELVLETRAGTIIGVSAGATETVYSLDVFPQSLVSFYQDGVALTGFSLSSKLDILQRRPGHKTINFDLSPTAVDASAKTVTFDNDDLASSIIVGDVIAFAGECIIPQVPSDLQDVLVQRVVQRVVQSLGDANAFKMSSEKIKEMEKNTGMLIDNRAEGSPIKAVNNRGLLRSSRLTRRGW